MVNEFEDIHYGMIKEWWQAHEMPIIPRDYLPTYGLIVPNIAAGFLISTDCNLGILEYFVSNPQSKAKQRDLALDQIVKGLIKYGESIGITNFKADTDVLAIENRAKRFGFKHVGEFQTYFLNVRE